MHGPAEHAEVIVDIITYKRSFYFLERKNAVFAFATAVLKEGTLREVKKKTQGAINR